jgi:hypothetical protein
MLAAAARAGHATYYDEANKQMIIQGTATTRTPKATETVPEIAPPLQSPPPAEDLRLIGRVPPFDPEAAGTPKTWNEKASVYNWSKKTKNWFKKYAPNPDFENIRRFFDLRPSPTGEPISSLLGEVKTHPDGWFRCPWLPFKEADLPKESSGKHATRDCAEWETAFHGCKFESLYSIMYRGRIEPSISQKRGDRYLTGHHGVYLFSPARKAKAYGYSRYVQLFGDGTFWSCVWEVRIDRTHRVVSGHYDQWVQPADSVRLEAIWFCARGHSELVEGWEVNEKWEPLEEANPHAAIWDDTVPDSLDEPPVCTVPDSLDDPLVDEPTIEEPILAEPSSAAPTTPLKCSTPKFEWAE